MKDTNGWLTTERVATGQLRRAFAGLALALTLACGATSAQAGIIIGDSVDVAVHAPALGQVCFQCGGVTRLNVTDDASDVVEPYLAIAGCSYFRTE